MVGAGRARPGSFSTELRVHQAPVQRQRFACGSGPVMARFEAFPAAYAHAGELFGITQSPDDRLAERR